MSDCCGKAPGAGGDGPLAWFANSIGNCLEHARREHAAGRALVGIMCEYSPRELILAAGALPACLCGGSAATIPAAEERLPSNLCPLIKSTYGFAVQRSNPFLEMAALVVAETTCDGKKKMLELLAEQYPVHLLELPQKQNDPDALEYWVNELRKLQAELERRLEVKIDDGRLRGAITVMNRERDLRRRLAALLKGDRPPLTGRQLLDLKSSISGVPADFAQYEKALELFADREGPAELVSRARVLLTGVPLVSGQERVIEIIESHGGLVVCQENCTGVKPVLEDVAPDAADPLRAIAEKYYHLPCSVMTGQRGNVDRLESLRQLAAEYRPECVVELVWQACLTYDVEAHRVKRLTEEELGLPYLRIETDYSPADSARIAVRVEALCEMVAAGRT